MPPPGLALDVARSPVPSQHFDDLFRYGGTKAPTAKALGAAGLINAPLTEDPGKKLLQGLADSAHGGQSAVKQYVQQNQDALTELYKDPATKDKFIRTFFGALGMSKDATNSELGIGSATGSFLGDLAKIGKFGLKASEQIGTALTVGPAVLAYKSGAAFYHDTGQILHGHVPTHERTLAGDVAKAQVKGVQQDIEHPLQNPGYLFMDALGAAALVGGGLARVSAASRVTRAGGSAGEIATALIRRPRPGTGGLRKGGMEENVLLSDNASVRAVQRLNLARRNRALAIAHDGGQPLPGGLLHSLMPVKAQNMIDGILDPARSTFSSQTKLRREREARQRVEHNLMMDPVRELRNAAGWSVNSAPVFGKIFQQFPEFARKGLTLGEQKAIQILSTDDPNPVALHRDFHTNMLNWGLGDPAAHRAQLAAIDLAEKALAKPSKRFGKALNLTRKTIAAQQSMKINDLGLLPEVADRRVIAFGDVLRTGESLRGKVPETQGFNPDAFYLPVIPKGKTRRAPRDRAGYFASRDAGYGLGPGQGLPELKHEFTGEALQAGDFRIDATNLAAESFARAARLATIRDTHNRLWTAATDKPRSHWDRPIRDVKEIPQKLREVMEKIDSGEITAADAEILHPEDKDALIKYLYPGKKDASGVYQLDKNIPGVRWVDKRLLDIERAPVSSSVQKVGQVLNEPFRDITLFLRPAYILNAVGNGFMALMHQGHHAPPNLARAIYSNHLYGADVTRTLDTLVGNSRSASYVANLDSALLKVSKNLAHGWNIIADQAFRRASIIHEMRQIGYKTKEDFARALKDPNNTKDIVEASRRANKSMVEFDNLTWMEREVMRHWIFVYPWVSRSLVWSLRTLVEHPIKSDVLAHIGAQEEQEHPEIYKMVPEWFRRTGYVPVGFDKNGNPKVINPTSVNTFSTLSQLSSQLDALFVTGGDPTAGEAFGSLFGPAAKFGMHAATGRDDFGNAYPGGDFYGAAKEVLMNLPQVTAQKRHGQKQKSLKAIDVTNNHTLVERLNSGLKRTVFSPGWLEGYGQLATGGLTARSVDPAATVARYWREQSPAQRHANEMNLINRALQLQSDLLGQKIPNEVRQAVNLSGAITQAQSQAAKTLGRTPTDKESAKIALKVYAQNHRLTPDELVRTTRNLNSLTDPTDVRRFRQGLADKYGFGTDMRQWDANVRQVASFTKVILESKMQTLRQQGLTDMHSTPGTPQELQQAGRVALAFSQEAQRRLKDIATADDKTLARAQLRAWTDAQDHPITINGKRVAPSPVRLAWASLTDTQRQDHVASILRGNWANLSAFDKELLGRKVSPSVTAGWAALEQAKADYAAANPGHNVKSEQIFGAAKLANQHKEYAGILQDYLFSQKPLLERLQLMKPYQQMPQKAKFDSVIANNAKMIIQGIRSGNYGKKALTDTWKTWIKESIMPWLASPENKALNSWVTAHGGVSLLDALVSK